jgi:hypothetical protein
MAAPQLSVRSKKARDLAHALSARERRPIHAIVEDALIYYAEQQPNQSAAAFMRRMQSLAVADVDLEALIADHRGAHDGIDL